MNQKRGSYILWKKKMDKDERLEGQVEQRKPLECSPRS